MLSWLLRKYMIFALFLFSPTLLLAQRYGNSYVNISKKKTGGTVQPGDTLEIRTNYYFTSTIHRARYVDNIPTNTEFIDDSLRLITNEGLTYKNYTLAAGDDPATYNASPGLGEYNIRINIGRENTATNVTTTDESPPGTGYNYRSTDIPRVGGGVLITTAFRVRVTGNIGDTITLGAGKFIYRTSTNGTDKTLELTQYKILISNNDPICENSVGKNFVAEGGGTFDFGNTQNRSYGPAFMIPNYEYKTLSSAVQITDGSYAIVNNLSPTGSTVTNAQKRNTCTLPAGHSQNCSHRMFNGYWEIMGDHTGSTTPEGNPPVAPGEEGGYMLVVNADYVTSEAYRQTITGLCPNTSYEFSVWVRNICTNCGLNINGAATYLPGVYPNLTFAIDDLDRYSTGEVDTTGWMKKGFLFKTGEGQTSITISIRNNASGGGGNDWAIDDIALVTCNPALNLIPSGNANICYGNQVDISSTVRSFFNNYTHYKWERSTDNGVTWSTIGTGVGTPVYIDGAYEYVATLPPFLADSSRHLNQYRFTVASSAANLEEEDCMFRESTVIIVWVNDCSSVLETQMVDFTGRLVNAKAVLSWTVTEDKEGVEYIIEKKNSSLGFRPIATIPASQGNNRRYSYTDPEPVSGSTGYRIKIKDKNKFALSKEIYLTNGNAFSISNVQNPVQGQISFMASAPESGNLQVSVLSLSGNILCNRNINISKGVNQIKINDIGNIPSGNYILRITSGKDVHHFKIIKQ